jgi:arginine N-succinyltransferase
MARAADIDALYALSVAGGSGLTSLPADRDVLASKLDSSERAVTCAEVREAGAAILLVVELDGRVVGTSCIFPRVGAQWPFYSYRLMRQAARSQAIGRTQAQTLLSLVNDFDGEAEVGGLLIDPSARGHALGALAARARYLFMAAHREMFGGRVIAELRGWQDQQGRSPVWDAVGRHFYGMEFTDADRIGAISGNQFIADLGPRYPLYISLLPEPARAALGRPHDDGRLAYEMLLSEGFRAGDYVDIFDGGPTLVADIDAVRTVRECRQSEVTQIAENGIPSIVAAGRGPDFRVARGNVGRGGTTTPAVADELRVGRGDLIHHVRI